MEHEIGSWKMALLHGLIPSEITKPLGTLLGVNRMWTKRNDHASKVNVPREGSFEKEDKNQV